MIEPLILFGAAPQSLDQSRDMGFPGRNGFAARLMALVAHRNFRSYTD
jgi:hypothetical protein